MSIDELRKLARQQYLTKREEQKILVLQQEVKEFEQDIEKYGLDNLTKAEQLEYNDKVSILEIVAKRKDLNKTLLEGITGSYLLPTDYASEGKVDKKRKQDLLTKTDSESDKRPRNEWEEWEKSKTNSGIQLKENFEDPNSLNLPGSENYEFVFDESQNVDFVEDAQLENEFDDGKLQSGEREEELDEDGEVEDEEEQKEQTPTLDEVRKSLPIYRYRDEILEAVAKYQVLIFVGETGSGKTTQLPQYLCEAGYCKNDKKIAVTQPRRVAASSVAKRVAEEMGVRIGQEVGYSIRFDEKTSEKTLIKYCTDGMLLREFLKDEELRNYSAIIIDEAHERTINSDILLGLLKDILTINKDLKVIIASATVNSKKFSHFFNDAPIFNVPGRRFPVDIYYTQQPESNYIFATITTIFQIHLTQELPGDILVFLTGQEEIEIVEENLQNTLEKLGPTLEHDLHIVAIYANLPIEMQAKIFEKTPKNSRKVVLATNIAETSLTIDGIKYVIDPGFVKEKLYNPSTGMESLIVTPCSQASAQQRAGRAGRVGPGKCFRLYTKWSFKHELPKEPMPEILRSNLASVILLLLSLGIYDILNFEFLDKPSNDVLIKSLELLYSLGALNDTGKLTQQGKTMSEFPIDPMFSKALISSQENYNCLQEVLTIISMLSESGSLFYRPKNNKEQADKCKQQFALKYKDQGDHFMYLEVFNQWKLHGFSYQWCRENFVQVKTLKRVRNVRDQLQSLCERVLRSNNESAETNKVGTEQNLVNIKKALVSGFFANACRLTKSGTSYRSLKKRQEIFIHPSSSMFKTKPPAKLLIYNELVLTTREYMRNVLVITEEVLRELAPHYFSEEDFKKD